MQPHRIGFTSIAMMLACNSLASGGLLDPTSIERQAYAFHQEGHGSESQDYVGVRDGVGVQPFYADFSPRNWVEVSQYSTIAEDRVTMNGWLTGWGYQTDDSWYYTLAHSYLRETFVLTSAKPFTFSFEWDLSGGQDKVINAYLTGPSGDVFRQTRAGYGSGVWTAEGHLEPGQYEYYVNGEIAAYQNAGSPYGPTIGFSAYLTLTPEPATLALAALGALPLLRRRR